ncbi:beta-1,3-galactosyltransferase 9 [Rhinophrynus dorsalis]
MEEYFLQSVPVSYTDAKFAEIRERARKLDMHLVKENISKSYAISRSDLCLRQDIFLLSIIFSHPENRTRRETIRHTWGNDTMFKDFVVVHLFALGRPISEETQSEVLSESQIYKDIVEGNFLDTYHNRTLKMTMMMEWIVTFCPNARFILKTDQQMFVNVKSLADYLLSLEMHTEDLYIGRVVHQSIPDRDPVSLDFVPMSSYSETYYPDYCSATAMVMSQDVVRKIYLVSEDVTTLVPPDVFIGICSQRTGIVPIHSSRFSGTKHITYNRCCYKFIFSSSAVGEEELSFIWKDMNESQECSMLETYYGLVSCKVWTYFDKFKFFNMGSIKKGTLPF